jgi:vancomycin permeability regulator SanA
MNIIRKSRCLFSMLLLFYILILFSSCMYTSKAARKQLEIAREKTYDVVVVPGVPIINGEWSETMKGRIYWSKYLFDNGIVRNVLYSGSAVYSPYYEGIVMALYAKAIGIPAANVFYETDAEHSTENMYYSYMKAKEFGFESIALASDPFQTKTLKRFAKKRLSKDVGMIPMVMDSLKLMEQQMINPVIDFGPAFKRDFVSLKKREGFFKRLKGTMGLNIKYAD